MRIKGVWLSLSGDEKREDKVKGDEQMGRIEEEKIKGMRAALTS